VFASHQIGTPIYEQALNSKILSKLGFSNNEILPSAPPRSEGEQYGAESFHGAVTSSIKNSNRKYLRYRGDSSGKRERLL